MPTITDGNYKMGQVASLSLPPVLSCNNDAPCARKGCYAKSFRRFPPCVKMWMRNWRQWQRRPKVYESQLVDYLTDYEPPIFRWHVSGDIPDTDYWQMMLRIARQFPYIKFLAFTKQYDLVKGRIPSNMSVVLSAWPGFHIPAKMRGRFPVAWLRDHNQPDNRIPADAIECHGNCERCGICWSLPHLGRDVVFDRH